MTLDLSYSIFNNTPGDDPGNTIGPTPGVDPGNTIDPTATADSKQPLETINSSERGKYQTNITGDVRRRDMRIIRYLRKNNHNIQLYTNSVINLSNVTLSHDETQLLARGISILPYATTERLERGPNRH